MMDVSSNKKKENGIKTVKQSHKEKENTNENQKVIASWHRSILKKVLPPGSLVQIDCDPAFPSFSSQHRVLDTLDNNSSVILRNVSTWKETSASFQLDYQSSFLINKKFVVEAPSCNVARLLRTTLIRNFKSGYKLLPGEMTAVGPNCFLSSVSESSIHAPDVVEFEMENKTAQTRHQFVYSANMTFGSILETSGWYSKMLQDWLTDGFQREVQLLVLCEATRPRRRTHRKKQQINTKHSNLELWLGNDPLFDASVLSLVFDFLTRENKANNIV